MRLRQPLIAGLLVLTFGVSAEVLADQYWDTNGAAAGGSGSDTAPGTWGVDGFWSADPNGAAATGAWTPDETAVFSADTNVTGTYDVTVSGTQSATGIRFEEGTVTVKSGQVNLTNTGTVDVATNLTATINSVIGGAVGLRQSGTGTLVLNGANTYTGDTKMASNPTAGVFNTLKFGAAGVIPDTSVLQILGQNSIIDLNGQTETVKSIASVGAGAGAFANSRIDVGTGNLIINDDLNEVELYESNLFTSSTGKITKNGSGQLNLNSTNSSWQGEFVLNSGLLGIGLANTLGQSSSGTAKLTLNGGTITFFNDTSKSIQTQKVDITGSFTALMGASNMELLGVASGGEGTAVVTLKTANPTITVTNVAGKTGVFIFRGPIGDEGANRGFTKAGAGALTLNNPNSTYTGATTILAGQLRIDDNATLGSGTGAVNLSGGALNVTVNRDPNTLAVPNPIIVTADSIISTTRATVDSTVNLNLSTNSVSGTGGTLTFRNDAVAGGALPANQFEPQLSGSGFNFGRPVVIAAGLNSATRTTRLNLGNSIGTQTFSGAISGAGKLRRLAGGTTVLTATNSYTGGTEVEGGALTVSGATATVGGGAVSVTGGLLSIASGVANAIDNAAAVSISGTGKMSLGSAINDGIASLTLGGVLQPNGTYGSSLSAAMFKLDAYFDVAGSGILTVGAPIAGDFDGDGDVDDTDYNHATLGFTARFGTDLSGTDFLTWQRNFGTNVPAVSATSPVPEPASCGLAALAVAGMLSVSAGRGLSRARRA